MVRHPDIRDDWEAPLMVFMCGKNMTLDDSRKSLAGGPPSPTPRSAERPARKRHSPCSGAILAAGMAFLLAGCELPSGFEDLTKIFDGETQEAPVEQAATDAEQPQSEPAEPSNEADTAASAPTREMTLTAQTLLVGLGYDPGPLDGLDGPMTRDAVRRYQSDTGTPVDGRITKALLDRLSESDHDEAARNENDDIDLASKALPFYAAGDTFIYSDGRTETVTDIDGDQVQWRSNSGSVTTAFRDFVLPAIRRESDFLSEQTTVDAEPGALVGRSARLDVRSLQRCRAHTR